MYHDPYVWEIKLKNMSFLSIDLELGLVEADCVVTITNHSHLSYQRVGVLPKVVLDTRNATQDIQVARIIKLKSS